MLVVLEAMAVPAMTGVPPWPLASTAMEVGLETAMVTRVGVQALAPDYSVRSILRAWPKRCDRLALAMVSERICMQQWRLIGRQHGVSGNADHGGSGGNGVSTGDGWGPTYDYGGGSGCGLGNHVGDGISESFVQSPCVLLGGEPPVKHP